MCMDSNNNTAQRSSMSMVVIKGANGEIHLPPGYKFKPEDTELMIHYLKKKILNQPMSFGIEFLMDLYSFNPDQLPFDECDCYVENVRYFFTFRYKENQLLKDGSWKVIPDSMETISIDDQVVGWKQKLLFHWTNQAKGESRTHCSVQEYGASIDLFAPSEIDDDINEKISNTVVCKVVRGEDIDADEDDDDFSIGADEDDKYDDGDGEKIDHLNKEIEETTLKP